VAVFSGGRLSHTHVKRNAPNVPDPAGAGGGPAHSLHTANAREVERARTAHDALSAMLAPPQVGPLVEALVAKYVALSGDELEEWQADPEGYIRSLELEAAPDADTPRPVGVGLLLCMLERGGEGPGRALIDLAASLQQQGDGAPAEVLLMREACYRCERDGGTGHRRRCCPWLACTERQRQLGAQPPNSTLCTRQGHWRGLPPCVFDHFFPQLVQRRNRAPAAGSAGCVQDARGREHHNGRAAGAARGSGRGACVALQPRGNRQAPVRALTHHLLTRQHPLLQPLARQARALWLVGACCSELPQQQWVEAYGLCVAHMGAADLVVSCLWAVGLHSRGLGRLLVPRWNGGQEPNQTVPSAIRVTQVALQAVQAVMMMTAALLDDQAVLDQANAAQLQAAKQAARGGAGAIDAALSAAEALDQGGWDRRPVCEDATCACGGRLSQGGDAMGLVQALGCADPLTTAAARLRIAEAVVAARERLAWRSEALQALLSELLSSCFGLLGRLSEVGQARQGTACI
jgi:hypothetical protein